MLSGWIAAKRSAIRRVPRALHGKAAAQRVRPYSTASARSKSAPSPTPPTRKHPSGSTLTCQSPWQISRAYCDCGWSKAETVRLPSGKKPRFERGSRRYSSSSCGFCTGDFLRAVTKRPEDRVGLRRSTKVGIDVFPNNFSVSGDLEKASEGGFVD